MTKCVCKFFNIVIDLFHPDHPNSIGIGSSISQQHGNWKKILYIFMCYSNHELLLKKDRKIIHFPLREIVI